MLKGKKIILGITGSIAAYKAASLTRLLVKEGAEVKVVMTPLAKEFITPVTMATLANNPVMSEFFSYDDGDWHSHVSLGVWADLFLVAPASANTMAKMANGICDNLLLTTYLSMRCPVMIAPAMDMDMFAHPATQNNIKTLKERGNIIVEPASGELASGLIGKGRMEEPEAILEHVKNFFQKKKRLSNKKFLITAGPTYELIDPVRFIGNFSSGKMGYALAEEIAAQGGDVTLVSGPVNISVSNNNISVVNVVSASQMLEETKKLANKADVCIMAAAVADYTPETFSEGKLKKKDNNLQINLIPTADIAAEIGKKKKKNQILVGFALENENEKENAFSKLTRKNLDFIVLNSLNDKGAGFGFDTNKITIIDKNNKIDEFELKHKREVANDIINKITELW
ncbi:MAG: bifunctional phosphopantothenoylcysteine decarboxylase/phosphopantothenate--cysteine ligase CoaBC [Bacteroidales bacterium]|nr:bifunctional phosphopantothenoylcysteine decarboxylase/phosphopantothenate--cysteine ligase CoaBC [Bacteroidales bacterium]